jgi:Flp pilus assembly pilin Flp
VLKTICSYVSDERGVETLEWIVVGALIVAIGIAIYPGTLQTQLSAAVNAIGGTITGLASS